MARMNWNRPGKVHVPWYDDREREITPDRKPWRKPKAALADPEEAFAALLAIRVDTYASVAPLPPDQPRVDLASGTIESTRADLSAAKRALVHCDGCCVPNPGRGGWGALIDVEGVPRTEMWGGNGSTTNNKMELTAAIMALTVLPAACSVEIVTDSQYLVKGATIWMPGWKRKAFKRGDGEVTNADWWRQIDALTVGRSITWKWVRGHSGNAGNERADFLAATGMRSV